MKKIILLMLTLAFMLSFHTPTKAIGFDIPTEVKVPILMYHFLAEDDKNPNPWQIRVEQFEADLIALKNEGYEAVFIQDLINFVYNRVPLPEKPIVISFDDGASDFYSLAFPLLKEHNTKAVMAIIGSTTDKFSEDTEANKYFKSNMNWEQIIELHDSGLVEIQSHSHDLHKGSGAAKKSGESTESYRERFAKDANKFNARVMEELGITPTAFIFPFGSQSKESNDVLKSAGLLASLTCREVVSVVKVGEADSLFDLGRVLRSRKMTSEDMVEVINSLQG